MRGRRSSGLFMADPVMTLRVPSKPFRRSGFWVWRSDQPPYLGHLHQQTCWFGVPSTHGGCPFARPAALPASSGTGLRVLQGPGRKPIAPGPPTPVGVPILVPQAQGQLVVWKLMPFLTSRCPASLPE